MTVKPFILFLLFSFAVLNATFSQSGYAVLVENGLTSIKDSINHIDEFKDGYARMFDKKDQLNYVNKKGKKISPYGPVSGYSQESGPFPKKYFVFRDAITQQYGMLDTVSQVVLKPDYNSIAFFGSYITVKKDNKAAVLDANLNTVFDSEYENIKGVNNAFVIITTNAKVPEDRKRGVYDLVAQKMIVPFDNYIVIHDLSWAFIAVKKGSEGLFDLSGKMIVPLNTYNRLIAEAGDSKFIHGLNNEGHTVIDSVGKVVVPAGLYDDIMGYNKETDIFLVKKNAKWGAINVKNEMVIPTEYSELGGASSTDRIFRATKDGETFFLSRKNYPLGSFKYEMKDGYRKYIYKDTTGYVDASGQIHPFPEYKTMTTYNKKVILVCNRNNKWGLMNGDFKLVADTVYDVINDSYKGYYIVRKGGRAGVIDLYGKTHIPVTNRLVDASRNYTFIVINDDKQTTITVKRIEVD